jgi:hypothetical protein
MAFDGKLLSRPSGPERPLGDALVVAYGGVYLPPPLGPVLTPNADGVSDRQRLEYRVVRPSTVTVNLLGPDGVARYSFSGAAAPGTYALDWPGTTPDGLPELEGRRRWVVIATDDAGAASSAERDFMLNRTLGFAAPVGPTLTVPRPKPRPVATFELTCTGRTCSRCPSRLARRPCSSPPSPTASRRSSGTTASTRSSC